MGKRKGRQRNTAFTLLGDAEFKAGFYDRRDSFNAVLRLRVEREADPKGPPQLRPITSGIRPKSKLGVATTA